MDQDRLRVVVAGVPRSYQTPRPDGRWLTDRHAAAIRAVSPGIELIHASRAQLEGGAVPDPGADVLLIETSGRKAYGEEIPLPAFEPLVTSRLRWVQSCSSGVGHILELGLLADGVALTNAAGVHAGALAESVMAAILMDAKRLRERLANQRDRLWQELHCQELPGKTLCVLGTGHIGARTAGLAAAFGMDVLGVRRQARPTPNFDQVFGRDGLADALSRADYLLVACPLTPETEGMLDAAAFTAMKPGAYYINVARGRVADEAALLRALDGGRLRGAFIDAFAQEPLPADHPLWSLPNVVVTPHDSHSSPLIGDNIVALFRDNLRRLLAGEPLRNLVDRSRGY